MYSRGQFWVTTEMPTFDRVHKHPQPRVLLLPLLDISGLYRDLPTHILVKLSICMLLSPAIHHRPLVLLVAASLGFWIVKDKSPLVYK
jgi:hypothetical protein